MSSFIVSDATINRIIFGIDFHPIRPYVESFLNQAEHSLFGEHGRKRLSEALVALNRDAVNQRYGESEPPPEIEIAVMYPVPLITYKAICCWLYQCSEGDVPEKPLYRAMDKIRNLLADHIVSRLPGYEDLPGWE